MQPIPQILSAKHPNRHLEKYLLCQTSTTVRGGRDGKKQPKILTNASPRSSKLGRRSAGCAAGHMKQALLQPLRSAGSTHTRVSRQKGGGSQRQGFSRPAAQGVNHSPSASRSVKVLLQCLLAQPGSVSERVPAPQPHSAGGETHRAGTAGLSAAEPPAPPSATDTPTTRPGPDTRHRSYRGARSHPRRWGRAGRGCRRELPGPGHPRRTGQGRSPPSGTTRHTPEPVARGSGPHPAPVPATPRGRLASPRPALHQPRRGAARPALPRAMPAHGASPWRQPPSWGPGPPRSPAGGRAAAPLTPPLSGGGAVPRRAAPRRRLRAAPPPSSCERRRRRQEPARTAPQRVTASPPRRAPASRRRRRRCGERGARPARRGGGAGQAAAAGKAGRLVFAPASDARLPQAFPAAAAEAARAECGLPGAGRRAGTAGSAGQAACGRLGGRVALTPELPLLRGALWQPRVRAVRCPHAAGRTEEAVRRVRKLTSAVCKRQRLHSLPAPAPFLSTSLQKGNNASCTSNPGHCMANQPLCAGCRATR